MSSRALRPLPLLALVAALSIARAEESSSKIEAILIHPPYSAPYSCSEHWNGQFEYRGDALGADCTIAEMVEENGRKWMRPYSGDGLRNEDWFGWEAPVLASCDCTVAKIHINPETNLPGILGKPPSSSITFEQADGVQILIAHIAEPKVEVGDTVVAGQPIAKVGNNGYSRQPHVHIAAWRGQEALQLRFDQTNMGPRAKSE